MKPTETAHTVVDHSRTILDGQWLEGDGSELQHSAINQWNYLPSSMTTINEVTISWRN